MLTWLGRIAAALAVLVAGAGLALYESDIPRAELTALYGGPDSQFVQLASGGRAHYRDRGPRDAPVLLLLHGSNASLHTWEPWATELAGPFRVVTVDLPGHGLTGAVPDGVYTQKAMAGFVLECIFSKSARLCRAQFRRAREVPITRFTGPRAPSRGGRCPDCTEGVRDVAGAARTVPSRRRCRTGAERST